MLAEGLFEMRFAGAGPQRAWQRQGRKRPWMGAASEVGAAYAEGGDVKAFCKRPWLDFSVSHPRLL